jgi:MoxR-like ATPase
MSSISQTSDSIEFHCSGCGRALRVPVSAAGKRASCPQCNTVVQVPVSSQMTMQPAPTPLTGARPSGIDRQPSGHSPPPPPPPTSNPATVAWALPPQPPAAPPHKPEAPARDLHPPPQPSIPSGIPVTRPQSPEGRETPTKQLFDRITAEIAKIYVGQDELVLGALVALFSSGHVLIEAVPGLGKTLFVRTLGRVMGLQFGRIQFTADLMPSDITGAPILDMKSQEFRFRPGPVFTQLLLADEINRAPAKTHAALLEIMQEYRVTVDGKAHPIERPFLVLATQNPIESEGTYNLPEAQLDRFMFKLVANYPHEKEEATILKMHSEQRDITERLESELATITSAPEILKTIQANSEVRIDDRLVDYINKLVRRTREWPQLHVGASPRAGISLMQAARTLAAFSGRDYAVPDDVFQIALPALRHRVALTADAEVEGHKVDNILTELIRSVEVPRL